MNTDPEMRVLELAIRFRDSEHAIVAAEKAQNSVDYWAARAASAKTLLEMSSLDLETGPVGRVVRQLTDSWQKVHQARTRFEQARDLTVLQLAEFNLHYYEAMAADARANAELFALVETRCLGSLNEVVSELSQMVKSLRPTTTQPPMSPQTTETSKPPQTAVHRIYQSLIKVTFEGAQWVCEDDVLKTLQKAFDEGQLSS